MRAAAVITPVTATISTVAGTVARWIEAVDSSAALLNEGYLFGSRRFTRSRADLFETRLMLTRATFTYGEEAARCFYEGDRLSRRGALPLPTLTLLQDLGSVQVLDDEEHRWRKAMFLSLMTPAALDGLADVVERHWREQADRWATAQRVVLLDALHQVLCQAVCEWSGVPLAAEDVPERTRQFVSMFEGAGAVGPRNWRGQVLRHRTETWLRDVIEQVRSGRLTVAAGTPLHIIATHRGLDGRRLSTAVAAVELINVLRPTIAGARFMMFGALALHEHPQYRSRVADDDEFLPWFVQEVRRYYAFFPLVGGRVLEEFTWRGQRFRRGDWLLLDLYATNHDQRIWGDSESFRPERFQEAQVGAFGFVPQGGGDHSTSHRCPGEWITVRTTERVLRLLGTASYDLPAQDLTIDLTIMPTAPRSRLVLQNFRVG